MSTYKRFPEVWYLDTGASNDMTGDRDAFATLDETVTGMVKFGDGSSVQIDPNFLLPKKCTARGVYIHIVYIYACNPM